MINPPYSITITRYNPDTQTLICPYNITITRYHPDTQTLICPYSITITRYHPDTQTLICVCPNPRPVFPTPCIMGFSCGQGF